MATSYARFVMGTVLLFGLLLRAALLAVEAGEPQEKIRQTINNVLAVLADDALKAPERSQERREKIRQVVFQRFGFQEMAQRALGRHWRKLTQPQRDAFVPLFSHLLERSYINKIEGYAGRADAIRYLKEKVGDDGYATVLTEIPQPRDLDVEVEYRLLQRQGRWTIYDVVIEGISLVNNYRTQFNKIIRQDSFETLIKKLKLKLEQEEAAERPPAK